MLMRSALFWDITLRYTPEEGSYPEHVLEETFPRHQVTKRTLVLHL